MTKRRVLLASHVAALTVVFASGTLQSETKRIVGYYYGPRNRTAHELSAVPTGKLTHLIYSVARPDAESNCQLGYPDIDGLNLKTLRRLRVKNPQLVTLLSVGGWSGSTYFSDIALTPENRKTFSMSCLGLMKKYGFDGLDVDWEYPVTGGKATDHKRVEDKENFVLLLERLRNDFDAYAPGRHLLLTVASTCYRNHLNDLSAKRMSAVLDWFNLMCYDLNDMVPTVTFPHSPLFAPSASSNLNPEDVKYANTDGAVKWYLDHGVPRDKIVLGLPFYGQIWSNVSNANNGLYQPFEGRPGEQGTLTFRDIKKSYLPTYRRYWEPHAEVPWLYNDKTKTMISYEDAQSVTEKAKYVLRENLGGLMFWDLSEDDDRSTLLNAIYEQLGH